MFDYSKHIDGMPREQYIRLQGIAMQLWGAAWRMEGNHGRLPHLAELSFRNRKRWFGAALACEALMARALQDTTQQDLVIQNCIDALEKLKGPATIK